MIDMNPNLIKNMAREGQRLDGRSEDQMREITIEKGLIPAAEGSARVTIGDTEVVAGIKISIGQPFGDKPNEGVLMVGTELVALADPEFESGPPREDAVEISRVVDRTIRESKALDLKKLCIEEGEKVWMVSVDINVMNYDGNYIDATSIAAIAALMDAKLPKLDEEGKIIVGELTDEKLPITGIPIATTFAKISGKIFTDPSKQEWNALDSRLTIGTVDKDGKIMLSAMQKGGNIGMSMEDVDHILHIAEQTGQKIREKLQA